MTIGPGIPDVGVVLKKKPGGKPYGNARSNSEGSFSFENVPFGAYDLTFDVPKLSPAIAGKVEYLVLLEQFKIAGGENSTARTYSNSKSNTAKRIAVDQIKKGFDLTVGPEPQGERINTSKGNIKNRSAVDDSQMRMAVSSLRGKILLVETGTTNIAIGEPGVKATREQINRLTISFYSIGSGTDGEAIKSLNEYLSSYEKAKGIRLAREEVRWGKEGEIDYCLRLTEIAPKEQVKVIAEIRSLLKNAKFVRIEENVPCRNKQYKWRLH